MVQTCPDFECTVRTFISATNGNKRRNLMLNRILYLPLNLFVQCVMSSSQMAFKYDPLASDFFFDNLNNELILYSDPQCEYYSMLNPLLVVTKRIIISNILLQLEELTRIQRELERHKEKNNFLGAG